MAMLGLDGHPAGPGYHIIVQPKNVTQRRGKSPFVALRCYRICMQLASGPRISSIKLDRKGRRLLASCSDRVLRVAEVAAPSEQQRQQAFPAEQALSRARVVSRVSLLSTQPKACAYAASTKHKPTSIGLEWKVHPRHVSHNLGDFSALTVHARA